MKLMLEGNGEEEVRTVFGSGRSTLPSNSMCQKKDRFFKASLVPRDQPPLLAGVLTSILSLVGISPRNN